MHCGDFLKLWEEGGGTFVGDVHVCLAEACRIGSQENVPTMGLVCMSWLLPKSGTYPSHNSVCNFTEA